MAARGLLASKGFAATSLRDVAGAAGVDPALLSHYFGSKEGLFAAAVAFPFDPGSVLSGVLDGDPAGMGERLAAAVLGLWEQPGHGQALLGMLRWASSDEKAAKMLSGFISAALRDRLAQRIGGEEATLRASLAGSHLLGVVLARHVLAMEPIATAPIADLAHRVGAQIQGYLTVDDSSA